MLAHWCFLCFLQFCGCVGATLDVSMIDSQAVFPLGQIPVRERVHEISGSYHKANLAQRRNLEEISNDAVSVGIDMSKGCSITEFVDKSSGVNMINSYDLGREVQPSFYSGPSGYGGCVWNNQEWSWNPIGSGDAYGNPSEVLSYTNDGTTITCSVVPMQWACDNVPCECTFNMTYSVRDSAVYSSVTLVNARSDHTEYGPRDQEFPAVYVNGFLYRLFAYTGDSPWTGAPMQEMDAGFDSWWVPGHIPATESFVAFAADDGFSVGVYNSGSDVSDFIAGFSGEKGSGGDSDASTGYMAPTGQVSLAWNEVYQYEYVIMMGTLDTVRNYAYKLHSEEVTGRSLRDQFL